MAAQLPWAEAALHHVALAVADLAAAEAFYAGKLGLPVRQRLADAQGAPRSVWLGLAGGALLMLERRTATGAAAGRPGWTLLALRIAPAARGAARAALAARGIAVTGETAFTLYITDPEGNQVGLSHHPDPAPP